jgi:hypothetical protein
LLDLGHERVDHRDRREHERSPGCVLGLVDAALGRAPELGQQLRGFCRPEYRAAASLVWGAALPR